MEGSAHDDGFEEGTYPPAPLPSHERTWRHPSEVGQAAWIMSEPPVAIGRGLLVTTGAIGCVLGIAILWLMIPSGSFGESASAPSRRRSALVATSAFSGTSPTTTVATLHRVETIHTISLERSGARAIAVSIDGSDVIVTTRAAIGDSDTRVTVRLDSGETMDGYVVSRTEALAYIAGVSAIPGGTTAKAASIRDGERLTVLGHARIAVTYSSADASFQPVDDTSAIAEGTPVVNSDGDLVGLCTRHEGSLGFVALITDDDDAEPAS